jgi:hypothetical protein
MEVLKFDHSQKWYPPVATQGGDFDLDSDFDREGHGFSRADFACHPEEAESLAIASGLPTKSLPRACQRDRCNLSQSCPELVEGVKEANQV